MDVCSESPAENINTVELHLSGRWLFRNPTYPDGLDRSGKFVENFTKLICIEIAGYHIKYDTVLWLLELQIVSD